MADLKISQLTGASTPLAGTEVVPLVQSSTTKKVSVANLTAGRTVDVAILLANSTSVDGNWKVQANASASGLAGIGVNNNGGYGAYLIYDNSGRYAGGGAAIRNIANTPIYIETNNTIIGQFDTSGNYVPATAAKGVNFTANTPAAGMTSQLLNWYEEGTWTPTYSPASGAFTSVTYNTNTYGRYTRVGRLVTIQGIIITDELTLGTAVGNLRIAGLPFSAAKDAAVYAGYVAGFNTNNPSAGYVSGSVIFLTYRTTANGATSNSMAGDLTTGASAFQNYLTFSTSYIV
jgi:hypothetical protein